MTNLHFSILFLVCSISQCYTTELLECYSCTDCDHVTPDNVVCLEDNLSCGKLIFAMKDGEGKDAMSSIIKGCIPRVSQGGCKNLSKTLLQKGGLPEGTLQEFDEFFDLPNVMVECVFCDTDYCNSSIMVYSSFFAITLLLALLRIF